MRAFWFALFLFYTCSAFAQGGIYVHPSDYVKDSLNCHFFCDSGGRLQANTLLGGKSIKVISHGNDYHFLKDSIFGYKDCDSTVFRIYHPDHKAYRILENKPVVIYSSDMPLRTSMGKPVDLMEAYFFSTGPDSAIYPLTVLELKRAFPALYSFHTALDLAFGDSLPIQTYDGNHRMYLVNYLLQLALRTK